MEFPINTQEEFDAAISERLKRERETVKKGFADYDEIKQKYSDGVRRIEELEKSLQEANTKIGDLGRDIADKDGKIKGYETDSVKTRIAHELGLSYDAIAFLSGEDEDAIRKSGQTLRALVGSGKGAPPLRDTEEGGGKGSEKDERIKNMLRNLKGEE